MRSKLTVVLLCAFAFTSQCLGSEGDAPYSISRLEWLSLHGTVACETRTRLNPALEIFVRPYKSLSVETGKLSGSKDTLYLSAVLERRESESVSGRTLKSLEQTESDVARSQVELCVSDIKQYAKAKGWSWLKFEVETVGDGWLSDKRSK